MGHTIWLRVLWIAIAVASCSGPLRPGAVAAAEPSLRLLILSGANNHDWRATTPLLQEMYEKSGRFTVRVTEDVPNLPPETFAQYDVIVCNYTTYPKVEGHRWPTATEDAFLEYMSQGGGFVLFHAASTAWSDWPEFGRLIGLTWRKDDAGRDISGHGELHAFLVQIVDREHPVTRDMPHFQHVRDELYHRQLSHPTARVLATTFSAAAHGGSDQDEPMVVVTQPGKGRVFHCALGHDEHAMAGAGFQTLMLRGTEWAATGLVTLPIPRELIEGAK